MTSSKRKNITQPSDWWDAFECQAKVEGLSLSKWVGECCVAFLPEDKARQLTERPAANRPKSDLEE